MGNAIKKEFVWGFLPSQILNNSKAAGERLTTKQQIEIVKNTIPAIVDTCNDCTAEEIANIISRDLGYYFNPRLWHYFNQYTILSLVEAAQKRG